jgi:hypothetical protein
VSSGRSWSPEAVDNEEVTALPRGFGRPLRPQLWINPLEYHGMDWCSKLLRGLGRPTHKVRPATAPAQRLRSDHDRVARVQARRTRLPLPRTQERNRLYRVAVEAGLLASPTSAQSGADARQQASLPQVADRTVSDRLLHRLPADLEEQSGGDAGEPMTRLRVRGKQGCLASPA